jgi:hypothetical protein
MAEEAPRSADVYVGAREAPGAESGLVDALAALGFTVRVKVWPVRRAMAEVHWLFLVALPLQAFLGGIGARFADDVYGKLKEALRRTPRESDPGRERAVVLQDTETGVRILLGRELDDSALDALRDLDLTGFGSGTLRYDTTEARWVPVPADDSLV